MKPLQIGITGGIGSGKSLVCKIFEKLGASVYDADSRAKYLMTTDGILISQIKKEFGDLSYQGPILNRVFLAQTVFSDEQKLFRLNQLVHPRVHFDYQQWVDKHDGELYVIKEAALMFESKSNKMLDKVIVVYAPEALRIKRVTQRDQHRSEKQIKDIIQRQWPEEEKMKQADFVIYNDEHQLVTPRILELHQLFSNEKRNV